jgi:hypothetical protein
MIGVGGHRMAPRQLNMFSDVTGNIKRFQQQFPVAASVFVFFCDQLQSIDDKRNIFFTLDSPIFNHAFPCSQKNVVLRPP